MKTEREAMLKSMSHPAKATPQSPTPTPMVMDAQAVFKLCQDHAALQAENAELREALKTIADNNCTCEENPDPYLHHEFCSIGIAKQALARPPEVK